MHDLIRILIPDTVLRESHCVRSPPPFFFAKWVCHSLSGYAYRFDPRPQAAALTFLSLELELVPEVRRSVQDSEQFLRQRMSVEV